MDKDINIVSISGIMPDAIAELDRRAVAQTHNILRAWQEVLSSIKPTYSNSFNANDNEGKLLLAHTRIVDIKSGTLLVEVEHPGWGQMLNMHKKYIITGLNMKQKDCHITNILIRTLGQDFTLHDKIRFRKEIKEPLSKEELERKNETAQKLHKIFEKIQKNILTKDNK